jgi:hypothetical protein
VQLTTLEVYNSRPPNCARETGREHKAHLVECGGASPGAQQELHRRDVPPPGCQVQRRVAFLQGNGGEVCVAFLQGKGYLSCKITSGTSWDDAGHRLQAPDAWPYGANMGMEAAAAAAADDAHAARVPRAVCGLKRKLGRRAPGCMRRGRIQSAAGAAPPRFRPPWLPGAAPCCPPAVEQRSAAVSCQLDSLGVVGPANGCTRSTHSGTYLCGSSASSAGSSRASAGSSSASASGSSSSKSSLQTGCVRVLHPLDTGRHVCLLDRPVTVRLTA